MPLSTSRVTSAVAGNATPSIVFDSGGQSERLLSLSCTLITDATAADRQPVLLVYDSEARIFARIASKLVQTASKTLVHSWTDDIPDIIMRSGWAIRLWIQNGVVGDSFTYEGIWTWSSRKAPQ